MITIAAALTCFNRRALTLRIVDQLLQQSSETAHITIYVLDDASTDGTFEALSEMPGISVQSGDGQRYWSGGMSLAMQAAEAEEPQYILMINDDVDLDADAVRRLLAVAELRADCIVVGTLRSSQGHVSYGGLTSTHSRVRLVHVEPSPTHAIPIDTFHGNLVLIPRSAYVALGAVDGTFVHNYGDLDYGLRAGAVQITSLLAPATFGVCDHDSQHGTYLDTTVARSDRWRMFLAPKGRPCRDHVAFMKRHAGPAWALHVLATYLKFAIRVAVRA